MKFFTTYFVYVTPGMAVGTECLLDVEDEAEGLAGRPSALSNKYSLL